MKRTDYHVHLGYDSNRTGYKLSLEDITKGMNHFNISRSVIFSCPNIQPSEKNPYKLSNLEVLRASKQNPFLIPFMFIHPYRDTTSELENNCPLFKGYKLYSHAKNMKYGYSGIQNLDSIKLLSSIPKPFIFHIGCQDDERSINLIPFAERISSPVVIAHVGRLYKKDLKIISALSNIYIELSPLRALIENPHFISNDFKFTEDMNENYKMLADFLVPLFDRKLLWGSDRPWSDNLGKNGLEDPLFLIKIVINV